MKNKLLKTDYKKLRISLFLVSLLSCLFITTSYSQTTTTPNLTPQSFTTINGWSGTNLSSTHGNETIAGVSGKSIENTISLTNVGLSQAQINEGFTSTQGADIWFWSGNQNQNVTMTQILTGSNGEVITQNRIVPYTSSYYNTYSNIVIVDKNTQVNYNITSKFSFYESSNSPYHAAADLKNPTLSITYITDPTPPIVIPVFELPTFLAPTTGGTITELITEEQIKEIFKEEFIKVGLTVEDIGMTNLDYKEMATQINTTAMADMKEANPTLFGPATDVGVGGKSVGTTTEPTPITSSPITSSTSTVGTTTEPTSTTSSSTMNTTSDDKPTTKESSNVSSNSEATTKTSSTTTEKTETSTAKSTPSEDTKTEGSSSKTSSSENVSNEKGSTTASGSINTSNATPKDEKISVSVKAAVEKVERELKSIGDKTKAIQEIKLDGIKAGAPNLGTYENRAFYEPKYYNGVPNPDFYLQADIAQKPVYANVTLAAYTNNDPIGKQQAAMQEIQDEMNDIIIQLEQLKRK
jgi:hypothetical protein